MKDHMILHIEKATSSDLETEILKEMSDEKPTDAHAHIKSKESTSISSFQCTTCKRKFGREHHLNSHKLIHELSLQIR